MPPRRSSKRKSSSPYAGGRQSSARSQVVEVDLPTTTTPATTAQAVPPQDVHAHPPQTTAVCTPALLQPGQPGMPWNPVSAGSDLGLHVVPISTAVGSNISTPLVSAHDDLSLHVPKSIKEKIWNGEYIDISVLLNKEPSSLDTCTQKLVMVNGELIIKQAQEPVKIMDVEKWTNAFIIFSSVLIAKHPEHAQGLLKYMNSIRLGASRHQGLGWKAYDAQYRLRKSTKPLSDWGTVDNELWLVYMSQQNVQLSSQPATPKVFYCYDYNLKGQCLRQVCKYEHKCLNDNCNGSHPSIMCHSFNTEHTAQTFNHQPIGPRFPNRAYPNQSGTRASFPTSVENWQNSN